MHFALAQFPSMTACPEKAFSLSLEYMQEAVMQGASAIIFPELWLSGFDWEYNESHKQVLFSYMEKLQRQAQSLGIFVLGSMYFNTCAQMPAQNMAFCIDSQGELIESYAKTHLFSYHGEEKYIEAGDSFSYFDLLGIKASLAVCYDLRFPYLFRNMSLKGVELFIVPSAFPHPRLMHWQTLIRARAIENQVYILAVNQVGLGLERHGQSLEFFGHSTLVDPWGDIILEMNENSALETVDLDLDVLSKIRQGIQVLSDHRFDLA